jgi:hypothetical protein
MSTPATLPVNIKAKINKLPMVTRDVVAQRLRNAPAIPVVYEEACTALANVVTILDAKHFSDKAEALATWARIFKSEKAAIEAKRLKLQAFRKMGQLADELRPIAPTKTNEERGRNYREKIKAGSPPSSCKGGAPLGAKSVLLKNGLSNSVATAALRMARATEKEFNEALENPRSPERIRLGVGRGRRTRKVASDSLAAILGIGGGGLNRSLYDLRSVPLDAFDRLTPEECKAVKAKIVEAQELLDAMDERLSRRAEHAA